MRIINRSNRTYRLRRTLLDRGDPNPKLIGARLPDLLELLGDLVFRTETGQGRFILYNLGPLDGHGKFDVISIGADPEDAEHGVLEILPERLRA